MAAVGGATQLYVMWVQGCLSMAGAPGLRLSLMQYEDSSGLSCRPHKN